MAISARTYLRIEVAILTLMTFVLGVSIGLYIAAALISPAIVGAAK